ncbi:uncharacterized protein [Diadema setosum]|uniref:uncharacterized protein n=1 Tax=Diadema setosum TaxID=31175 RepID=UPI003B3A7BDF
MRNLRQLKPATIQAPVSPSLIVFNARSLNNKIDDLEATLRSQHKDVTLIAVTETWFSMDKSASACELPGYNLFHRDRPDRPGGGVCLYVRNDLSATEVFIDCVPTYLEVLWIKLKSSSQFRLRSHIYVAVVYSPPRSEHREELCNHLIDTVDSIRAMSDSASLLITGDFNDLDASPLEQHTALVQIVTNPTRGTAILDKIFTDIACEHHEPVICAPIANSDHSLISLKSIHDHACRQSVQFTYRPYRDSAVRSFGQWITEMDWSVINTLPDVNTKVDFFRQLLSDQYRSHFHRVTVKRRVADKAWMTNIIRSLISARNSAFKRGDMSLYKSLRNDVQRKIKIAKRLFYCKKVQQLKETEPGKWHKQIRSLSGLKKRPQFEIDPDISRLITANRLNTYFADICRQLPSCNLSELPAYLPAWPPPTIERRDVYNRLRRLNASKAGHPSDLPIRLLKEFAYELSIPLTNLFNECLTSGYFPDTWKTASVCPVPKTTPVVEFSQLRPISITPIIARIFEDFLAQWVMSDIAHVIDPRQFGNMKGSSVCHYLISMLDTIYKGLDKPGHYADLCAIDFTKAFDLVDHTTAVRKMIDLEVNPSIIPTICSFLSNRSQTVLYKGTTSSSESLACGVPQGTKLGPIIFLIMVNDLALTADNRWKYVDDLSIVEISHKAGHNNLQSHIESVCEWSNANYMTPKPEKCKLMHFTFLRNHVPPPVITIGNNPIEVVSSMRILGVTIRSDLRWDSQVREMISRASRRLYILCSLRRNGVTHNDLLFVYTVYIRPLLEFAAPVWCTNLTHEQSQALEKVQRRALRLISYPLYLPYNDALRDMNIESLSERRSSLLTTFGKSLLRSTRHRDMLPPQRSQLITRSLRNSLNIDIPRTRTQRFRNSTIPCLVRILNGL